MKIHAIQTGTVAIKSRQIQGVGRGRSRRLKMFLDRHWADPLPIYAFAVEHPEGVIVVDTGESAATSDTGYFPRWHPYFRYGLRERVGPEEEIGPQLQRLGIAQSDVRWVVLTHLHTDHTGGLYHFPHNEILVSQGDLDIAAGVLGRLRGYPNRRFPRWFAPTVVELTSTPYGPFPQSRALTRTGDVTLVPLAGHTPGQLGWWSRTAITRSSSPATRPTPRTSCCAGSSTARPPTMRSRSARTPGSASSPRRRPPCMPWRTTRPQPPARRAPRYPDEAGRCGRDRARGGACRRVRGHPMTRASIDGGVQAHGLGTRSPAHARLAAPAPLAARQVVDAATKMEVPA